MKFQEIPLSTPIGRVRGDVLVQFKNHIGVVRCGKNSGDNWERQQTKVKIFSIRSELEGAFNPAQSLGAAAGALSKSIPRGAFLVDGGRYITARQTRGELVPAVQDNRFKKGLARRFKRDAAKKTKSGAGRQMESESSKKKEEPLTFGQFMMTVAFVGWICLIVLWVNWPKVDTTWRAMTLPFLVILPFLGVLLSFWVKSSSKQSRPAYSAQGEIYLLKDIELPQGAEVDADRQVDEIKEEYGKLLSDIAYRVEFPALFDAANPQTEELTLALFKWDSSKAHLDSQERVELAIAIRHAFFTAKDHAERVGMDYLPASVRSGAETALKAIRLSRNTAATKAERRAALKAAIDILDDLALYYLPTGAEAQLALAGKQLLQLPGRRSQ